MKIKALLLTLFSIVVLSNLCGIAKTLDKRTSTGNATYYGSNWNGRRTSSGAIFNADSMTCAHRTLPFGTLLLVRNKVNGKEVVVKVTDRGPFRKGAIIDLTTAAAKKIDMVRMGVCPVEIAEISPEAAASIRLNADKDQPVLPELELYDPITGNYYSMNEWQKRDQTRRAVAKTNAAKQSSTFTAKAKSGYKVLKQNSTAKASVKK